MKDLSQGPISGHLARLGGAMMVGMVFQTLYYLIDLWFVSRVGPIAVAAVSLAGSLAFFTMAIMQALTVGTTALIGQAWGAKEHARARHVFNQSQVLAMSAGVAFIVLMFAARRPFANGLAADAATADALVAYLDWFVPALGVQFLVVAIGAALRGAGEVRVPTFVQLVTIVVNIVLCPVLIAGWGTGKAFGVAGAGMATFFAMVIGVAILLAWIRRGHSVLQLDPREWAPDWPLWRRMLGIGLPSGVEFLLLTLYMTIIYWLIRPAGAEAQAGLGIAMRIMQMGMIPTLAIAFALTPIAAQSFGARNASRVREAFRTACTWVLVPTTIAALACYAWPEPPIGWFTDDRAVVVAGAGALAILGFNFIGNGLIFVAANTFQALGNTVPSMLASASRLVLFAVPAIWASRQPWFALRHVWLLSVGSIFVQLMLQMALLMRELRRKLGPIEATAVPEAA
ncbi:MAG TPA: MATE family efflux transporter [Xanthomonadales bacterium]|nr:MATE family efflux transporter [Xanthomonadales bacterium]